MENVTEIIKDLLWSVQTLQKLIPDSKEWDNKAQAISDKVIAAKEFIKGADVTKFPFVAKIYSNDLEFIPTMIDYDNRQVWHQRSQVASDGEWIDFDDVLLTPNKFFNIV
jgi:hypothetical protein